MRRSEDLMTINNTIENVREEYLFGSPDAQVAAHPPALDCSYLDAHAKQKFFKTWMLKS